jgi:hypothetical protein
MWPFKRGITWHTLIFEKKKHIRQNVGKEKHKLACFGEFFLQKSPRYVQVMNFIPVKVSTLYILKLRYL